jgi:coenzyme F420-reducing hydrogenase delta subunit
MAKITAEFVAQNAEQLSKKKPYNRFFDGVNVLSDAKEDEELKAELNHALMKAFSFASDLLKRGYNQEDAMQILKEKFTLNFHFVVNAFAKKTEDDLLENGRLSAAISNELKLNDEVNQLSNLRAIMYSYYMNMTGSVLIEFMQKKYGEIRGENNFNTAELISTFVNATILPGTFLNGGVSEKAKRFETTIIEQRESYQHILAQKARTIPQQLDEKMNELKTVESGSNSAESGQKIQELVKEVDQLKEELQKLKDEIKLSVNGTAPLPHEDDLSKDIKAIEEKIEHFNTIRFSGQGTHIYLQYRAESKTLKAALENLPVLENRLELLRAFSGQENKKIASLASAVQTKIDECKKHLSNCEDQRKMIELFFRIFGHEANKLGGSVGQNLKRSGIRNWLENCSPERSKDLMALKSEMQTLCFASPFDKMNVFNQLNIKLVALETKDHTAVNFKNICSAIRDQFREAAQPKSRAAKEQPSLDTSPPSTPTSERKLH